MGFQEHEVRGFLTELYNITGGDITQQVSMYDVGTILGFDKSSAGALAEELIVDGYVELVTLSGGISITEGGLKELNITPDTSTNYCRLGDDKVLDEEPKKAVEEMLGRIRQAFSDCSASYDSIEEVVIDVKTIEVQLLSKRPKTAVIRELLISVAEVMAANGKNELSEQISAMTG